MKDHKKKSETIRERIDKLNDKLTLLVAIKKQPNFKENIDIEITTLETSLKRINEMLSMSNNTSIDKDDLQQEKHNCIIALRKAKKNRYKAV